jgi:riboflavin synthase
MFTGLVEAVGTIAQSVQEQDGRRLRIGSAFSAQLRLGESVAIDGVCLTVVEQNQSEFEVQVVPATIARTTAADWTKGRPVNLERSLRLGDRIGGHLVQGHVDAVGTVLQVERSGENVLVAVELPDVVAEVTVLHGSIAIDGVSLTVSALPEEDVAQVALIPHTLDHTNLRRLSQGSRVNLEGDLLGRFVSNYLKRSYLKSVKI